MRVYLKGFYLKNDVADRLYIVETENQQMKKQLIISRCESKILREELERFRGLFGDYDEDESPRTIEQATIMWDSLKMKLNSVEKNNSLLLKILQTIDKDFYQWVIKTLIITPKEKKL